MCWGLCSAPPCRRGLRKLSSLKRLKRWLSFTLFAGTNQPSLEVVILLVTYSYFIIGTLFSSTDLKQKNIWVLMLTFRHSMGTTQHLGVSGVNIEFDKVTLIWNLEVVI